MTHKIHRYIRRQHGWKKDGQGKRTNEPYIIFKCILPSCNHFIGAELAELREALCNFCTTTFRLTGYVKRLDKPHCGCRFTKAEETYPDFMKMMKGIE